MDATVLNAIPTWSYTRLKRRFSSDDPFFQVRIEAEEASKAEEIRFLGGLPLCGVYNSFVDYPYDDVVNCH